MTSAKQRIKDNILRKRGLESAGKGRLRPETIHLSKDKTKTLAMRLLEEHFKLPMEVLLQQGKEADIAKRLGVTISCISRWRLRLGLR